MSNTGFMPRKVVIAGYRGVQALDVIGPHDVFTTASLLTGGSYDVTVASVDGQPVSTATGLAFVAAPLPEPGDSIDTVVLPGGGGIDGRAPMPSSSPGSRPPPDMPGAW